MFVSKRVCATDIAINQSIFCDSLHLSVAPSICLCVPLPLYLHLSGFGDSPRYPAACCISAYEAFQTRVQDVRCKFVLGFRCRDSGLQGWGLGCSNAPFFPGHEVSQTLNPWPKTRLCRNREYAPGAMEGRLRTQQLEPESVLGQRIRRISSPKDPSPHRSSHQSLAVDPQLPT